MLRGICRCLHYFYIADSYYRVGRHFQHRSLLVSSCPQSAFGLTGGYRTAAPSELFCVRYSLLFAFCRLLLPRWATLSASFLIGFFLPPVSLWPDRGLLKGSSFRVVLRSGFAVVCVLQTGCFVSTRFFPLYRDRNAVIFP